MKKLFLALTLLLSCSLAVNAQLGKKINVKKATDATSKGVKSFTISDAEIEQYCQEYIDWMDVHNPVCSVNDSDPGKKAMAERLEKIVAQLPEIEGVKLDIKAYWVIDINAFACANGSVRVLGGLMEEMSDDEVLAVIGHEIGHVVNKDSKDAFVAALRMSALKDAAGAASGSTVAALTDSQLGDLAESLGNAQFSQKQESQADIYGFNLLKKINKDSALMAQSLGVLLKLQETAGAKEDSKVKKLFSSHPDLKTRIETLNKMK